MTPTAVVGSSAVVSTVCRCARVVGAPHSHGAYRLICEDSFVSRAVVPRVVREPRRLLQHAVLDFADRVSGRPPPITEVTRDRSLFVEPDYPPPT